MARLLVLHGPNLNLLGTREPGIYGHTELAVIDADLAERAAAAGHTLESFQSNAEHALVDRIQWFPGETSGTEDHAWYVWGPVGKPITPRLLYEGKNP